GWRPRRGPSRTTASTVQVIQCSPFDWHACWLPDGRFIAGNQVEVSEEPGIVFCQEVAVYAPHPP
ncbi:unnamed protein product, partial [Heterosigma akashiwo]